MARYRPRLADCRYYIVSTRSAGYQPRWTQMDTATFFFRMLRCAKGDKLAFPVYTLSYLDAWRR